jgi:hypothetical protein
MMCSEKRIVTKPSLHGLGKARSLPKLCSWLKILMLISYCLGQLCA